MSNLLKIITVLLTFLLLFTSCTADTAEVTETSANTEPVQSEPTELVISTDILEQLAVIRSDTSNNDVTKAAVNVKKAVAKALGKDIKITTDWEKNPVYDYEIIVGKTLREDTENVKIDRISLGEKGYTIKVIGNKIFIVGGSETGSVMAADYFVNNIVKDGSFSLPFDYEYIKYQEYDIPEIQINGKDSKSYPIICSSDNMKSAEFLRSMLYSKSGIWHEIVENGDETSDNAIILSSDKLDISGIVSVTVKGNSLVFGNSSSLGIEGCVYLFTQQYIANNFGSINFPSEFEYIELGDYIIVNY